MADLKKIDGIWVSDNRSKISYPTDGNQGCFQVEDHSFWFKFRNIIINEIFESYVLRSRKAVRILDLGGGNGFVARNFEKMGHEVHLVEPGVGALNARSRGLKNIYMCSVEDIPASLMFDIIGLFDVVEHISSPVDFLKSAGKHLNEEGRLLITVPAYQFLFSQEDVVAGHYRRYTLMSLKVELERAGFEVCYSSYFFTVLILPILFFRSIPYRLRGHESPQSKPVSVDAKRDLVRKGILGVLIERALEIEQWFIRKWGRLPFGSSLIIVAKKRIS